MFNYLIYKKMKKVFFVALIFVLSSCKNDKVETVKEVIQVEEVKEVKKEFIVKIQFKTNKEDDFRLLLSNIEVDEFQKKNIQITEKVGPASQFETITANFGENISGRFTINLGNKEVKEVEINSIKIIYGSNSIECSLADIEKHFFWNKYITIKDNKIVTVRMNKKHNPTLNLRKKYLLKLQDAIN